MDEKLIAALEHAGLASNEARLYLALLEIGEGTVQDVAHRADIKRTTAYTALDSLKERGFIFETRSHGHVVYIPERPTIVIDEFAKKIDVLAEHQAEFEKLYTQKRRRPHVLFFDGVEGFRKIWQIIFKSGIKEYLIITDPEQFLGFAKSYYIRNKIIQEKLRLKIKSRHLVCASNYAKEIIERDAQENRTSKILPRECVVSYTKIIFGDNVAIISPALDNTIFIVESELLAKTERALFDALWSSLPAIDAKK